MTAAATEPPFEPAFECNGRHVDKARFYAIACDPARHVAVEACAGAGKTWMLVSRILRALLAGCPPHEILAISFTRKAAGEMRQRLQEWLAEFAASEPEKLVGELVARGLDERAARAQAMQLKGLYRAVLDAGRPVQIRTFHGWFWVLLGSAPVSLLDALGLPVNAELIEDDAELVAQVWRRFHAALIARPEARADYQTLVTGYGRYQTQKALASALARRVEFTLADAAGVAERSVESAAVRFPEFAALAAPADALTDARHRAELLAAAKALGGGAPSFAAKGVELETALSGADANGVRLALLTEKGTPRKFSEKIRGLEQVRAAQELLARVQAAQNQHDAHQYQQRLIRLSRLLLEQFAALKRERGVIDMNDVERAAERMLGDPVLGGWLQQRLDSRVRHLLIDEFQDTNPLQWQALHAWLSGYAGAGGGQDGPSLFIVGDPKQSIYRFRRAEPQVFRAAQRFALELGGDLLSCDHTRRNAPALIGVINSVMEQAQVGGEFSGFRAHTTQSDSAGGAFELPQIPRDSNSGDSSGNGFDASAAARPTLPAGPRWRDSLTEPRTLPEETLRQLECRQAAAFIARQIAAGLAPRDIMVLARKKEPLAALEAELRLLHIAATQPEKRRLADAPEVQDIVALLDVLVSPGHDLSLARALRSPLFGLGDEALVQIALTKRERPGASWLDLLLNPELKIDAGQAEMAKISSNLARWKGLVDALPPHDALAAIYSEGDVLARFAAAAPAPLRETVQVNLRAVLSASLALDGARYATPYALVRALKSAQGPKAPMSVAPDAVQLLTVHGAKGLEAPLVLLLDAEGRVRQGESMGVLVEWPGEAAAPTRFVFLASEKQPSDCCAELLETERAARAREELNALYVAMTRARERLVLSSIEPYGSGAATGWRSRLAEHCEPMESHESKADGSLAAGAARMAGPAGTAGTAGATRTAETAGTAGAVAVAAALRSGASAAREGGAALATGVPGEVSPEATFSMLDLPFLPIPAVFIATDSVANDEFAALDSAPDSESPVRTASAEARVGRALHRLLEWALPGARQFSTVQVGAVAREFALDAEQAARAARMAARIVGGAAAWAWDAQAVDWQGNEVSLAHAGQVLRLDRLVRAKDTGEWWVLDYKSAHRPEQQAELIEQMQRYRAALEAAHAGAVVRAAFLTADGAVVEVR
ncbi:MAG: UvrD-helicase domain-containing protein [Burkholderiales bacterium]